MDTRRFGVAGLMLGASLVVLSGCGGDDGSAGAVGPRGQAVVQQADAIVVTINSVSNTDTNPVVNFTVTDQPGNGLIGLTSVRANFAKLVPSSNGDSSYWDAYVTSDRTGELVDNGDGTYTYTLAKATADGDATYDATATHRIALRASGDFPTANAVYTFQPSSGATTGIASREIVEVASCNECHTSLGMHGNSYKDTRYCVTCHTPELVDGTTGNTADFKVMVHKIHMGSKLPSVLNGVDYFVRPTSDGFSTVNFPRDIRDCTKCHDANNTNTPQAGNWTARPTQEVCGSCHDDVQFDQTVDAVPDAWSIAHPGGVQTDNSLCITCHQDGGQAGAIDVSHNIPLNDEMAKYAFSIESVDIGVPGTTPPSVRFKVTDPTNGDAAYDILSDAPWTAGRLTAKIGWSTTDYTNIGSASQTGTAGTVSTPMSASISALNTTDNLDGTFTVVFADPLPATVFLPNDPGQTTPVPIADLGSGTATLEGRAAVDIDNADGDNNTTTGTDRIPVQSVFLPFALDGASTPVARRTVVNIDKCHACHDVLTIHGDGRTDEPQLCVLCHNNNRTDLSGRPADTNGATIDINEGAIDGLFEQSVDFKRMIHGMHSSSSFRNDEFGVCSDGIACNYPYVIYRNGNASNFAEKLRFPGIINNCEICHDGDSYVLPLSTGVGGSTIDTGADLVDPADDLNITPTASVCSACHSSVLSKMHMVEAGGADFEVLESAIYNPETNPSGSVVETCVVCHGPDRIADVKVMHGIED